MTISSAYQEIFVELAPSLQPSAVSEIQLVTSLIYKLYKFGEQMLPCRNPFPIFKALLIEPPSLKIYMSFAPDI